MAHPLGPDHNIHAHGITTPNRGLNTVKWSCDSTACLPLRRDFRFRFFSDSEVVDTSCHRGCTCLFSLAP
jgi:hypothetical protein